MSVLNDIANLSIEDERFPPSKVFQPPKYYETGIIFKYKSNKVHDYCSFFPSNKRYMIFSNKKFGDIEAYDTFSGKRINLKFKNQPDFLNLFDYPQLSNFEFLSDDSGLFLCFLCVGQISYLVLAKLEIDIYQIHVMCVQGYVVGAPFTVIRANVVLDLIEGKNGKLLFVLVELNNQEKHCLSFQLIQSGDHCSLKFDYCYQVDWDATCYKRIDEKTFFAFPTLQDTANFQLCSLRTYRFYPTIINIEDCNYDPLSKLAQYTPIMDVTKWQGNTFYCAVKCKKTSQTLIMNLKLLMSHLGKMNWEKMAWQKIMRARSGTRSISSLTVDHNDLLILKVVNNVNEEQIEEYHRCALRTPQSLMDLTFYAVRRSKFKHSLIPDYLKKLLS